MSLESPRRRDAPACIIVVIVCRNSVSGLATTVEGLRRLADPRVRLVVIDAGSTDGTPAYLASLDDIAHYTVSEPDRGIYDAMNKGWRASPRDAYVLYLGAGDELISLPSDEQLLDSAGRPLPVIVGCCSVGTMLFRARWSDEMRLRNTAHHQALMIHRSVSPEAPFDIALRVYADWDFNLRLFKQGLRAHYVDSLQARAQPGGTSWYHDLAEIRVVARRHSGSLVGAAAWALNWASLRRRRRLDGG